MNNRAGPGPTQPQASAPALRFVEKNPPRLILFRRRLRFSKCTETGDVMSPHINLIKPGEQTMKVKSKVKAGADGLNPNHNQTVKGLRVKSKVKAGVDGMTLNHNQTVTRAA